MFQHNRQHIATRGKASAATARLLIANAQQPAPHVVAATIECGDYATDTAVVACRSKSAQVKCGVALAVGQVYFLVRSAKFMNRWYVWTEQQCSSSTMQHFCTEQVEAYRAARLAA